MANDIIHIDIEKAMFTTNGKINLTFKAIILAGEIVSIYGDSGAGKTTLLRMLAGLVRPDKGIIKFGDSVWFNSDKKINIVPQNRNIGLMFQDYALFPNMTIEQNISFAQAIKNDKAVHELLNVFGLFELRNRRPHCLSGGQKQRVAFARVLARKPKLLLLDEPLSAVDANLRSQLQDEILMANKSIGLTTILVSHDLNEVFKLANWVICIENGFIVKSGNPEEVFSDNSISGKVQITGKIARIEKQENINIVTVISGNNQIIKVIAFAEDIENMKLGDSVIVYTKAFNPIISKLN
jgi:molybdate transport system ATP-binding protein